MTNEQKICEEVGKNGTMQSSLMEKNKWQNSS